MSERIKELEELLVELTEEAISVKLDYEVRVKTKISKAFDFLMTWIIPVTLSIAFGVWYYSERIGYLYIE